MKRILSFLRRYKIHHLPAWAVLFFGWYYFRYQDYPPRLGWWLNLLKVGDLALMVYMTNYLLIPRLLYKKKYVLFACTFIVFVFSFSLLKMRLEEQIMHRPNYFNFWSDFKVRVYDNVIPHFLLVSTGAAFKLLMDYARSQRRLAEVSREKSEAELNFLKSQINPHLLFNSLNAIYFLIDKQNAAARQSLLQFSDLLRYQLYDCNADTIGIEKEITYLQDYIKLQRLRRDQHYEIEVRIGEEISGFNITPLLLTPFVENAFKHISHHTDQRNFVRVDLRREKNIFHFVVENSRERPNSQAAPAPALPGGIGLNNVKRRLALLYPEKHELKIQDNDATFKVILNLHLS
ncbi:MAG TPA: histidine kinase [Puia sp.]|nr:histidine kinase [Puia sp.]